MAKTEKKQTLQNVLQNRLKPSSSSTKQKMQALAQKSNEGKTSSFEGVFGSDPLSENELSELQSLLEHYKQKETSTDKDLSELSLLCMEVKAITKQAVILHGERIAKAQEILKNYKDGAFSAWLTQVYGNRQTPYNLLQYYKLWSSLKKEQRPLLEKLPRQATYTLATRQASLEDKIRFMKTHQGENKKTLLEMIRHEFPLNYRDRRMGAHPVLKNTRALLKSLDSSNLLNLSRAQAREALALTRQIEVLLKKVSDAP